MACPTQVLALFVALPPAISVLQLLPKLWKWFKWLAWVRRLTARWQPKKPKRAETMSISSLEEAKYGDSGVGDEDIEKTSTHTTIENHNSVMVSAVLSGHKHVSLIPAGLTV